MVIPYSYPLVGHVPRWLFDRFGFLEDCAASRLPIIELKLGRRAYLLNSPKDVGHVLDSCHQNYVKNPRLEDAAGKKLFGDSIQTQYGTPHQHQRRQVQPALMRRAVAGFIPQIVSTVDHGLQAWYGKEIDLIERTLWLVNCVLGRVLFDLDFDGCDRKFGEAIVLRRQQVNRQFALGAGLPGRRRQAKTLQWLQERVDTHIEARRRHPDRYADLLALLVQRQGPLTGPLIRDEAVGTSGGYETIAAMVIWTWYFLTQDPEIYARVQAEIESVLGQHPPTEESLSQLTYTRAVLSESLRLSPPTWIFVRVVCEADRLPSGTRLAPGTRLYLSPYSLHRHPDYFPAPHRFDPERFCNSQRPGFPKYSYFPFGGGPRVCIGQTLAELSALLIFVIMVQRLQLSLLPGQSVAPRPHITLLPGRCLRMSVGPRR